MILRLDYDYDYDYNPPKGWITITIMITIQKKVGLQLRLRLHFQTKVRLRLQLRLHRNRLRLHDYDYNRPHACLEYANVIWSPHWKKHKREIESVQRRATKGVPGMEGLSYEQRLQRLKLPTLVYRRSRGDMIEVYKIMMEKYDSKVSSSLLNLRQDVVQSERVMRGNTKKLYTTAHRTKERKNFFSNRVVRLWNTLPESVVSAPSTDCFKNSLDKFWRNQKAPV